MAGLRFTFDAVLWEHETAGAWHFASLPPEVSDQIDDASTGRTNGFGSVRVAVTIGGTSWETSIFPDTKRGTFVVPVKKPVRTAEGLVAGSTATIQLRVLLP